MSTRARVIAVLGKGGAGKTVVSALISRALLDSDVKPLLLVDADPTGGLAFALGAGLNQTMGEVREKLIGQAAAPDADPDTIAQSVDWLALEALQEHGSYSLLNMGRTESKGCFCPLNSLLRAAIEKLAAGFRFVILDAEAGIEQVNRQVVRQVDVPVIVTDGSLRGLRAAHQVSELLQKYTQSNPGGLILNRAEKLAGEIPAGLELWGEVPADDQVASYDHQGRSLLELDSDNPALLAVGKILKERVLSNHGQ